MPLKDTKSVGLEVPGAAALLRPGPLAQGVRPGQARGTSPQDQVSPQLPEIDESAYPLLGHLRGSLRPPARNWRAPGCPAILDPSGSQARRQTRSGSSGVMISTEPPPPADR